MRCFYYCEKCDWIAIAIIKPYIFNGLFLVQFLFNLSPFSYTGKIDRCTPPMKLTTTI